MFLRGKALDGVVSRKQESRGFVCVCVCVKQCLTLHIESLILEFVESLFKGSYKHPKYKRNVDKMVLECIVQTAGGEK